MNTTALESAQNELIREILNVNDLKILTKVKKLLRREEKKAETVVDMVAEDEVPYMSKSEILANFDQACKELKSNLDGKLEFEPIEKLLNEL